MRKLLEGRVLFPLFLAAVGACALAYAHDWTFKAALFPVMTGTLLLALALTQFILELRGQAQNPDGPAMDLEFSTDVSPQLARRRTIAVFAWMAGFILLVLFVGFSLAVPIFAFCHLRFQGSTEVTTSVIIAAAAWAFFYGLFERLLRLQFEAGFIQTWLGL